MSTKIKTVNDILTDWLHAAKLFAEGQTSYLGYARHTLSAAEKLLRLANRIQNDAREKYRKDGSTGAFKLPPEYNEANLVALRFSVDRSFGLSRRMKEARLDVLTAHNTSTGKADRMENSPFMKSELGQLAVENCLLGLGRSHFRWQLAICAEELIKICTERGVNPDKITARQLRARETVVCRSKCYLTPKVA